MKRIRLALVLVAGACASALSIAPAAQAATPLYGITWRSGGMSLSTFLPDAKYPSPDAAVLVQKFGCLETVNPKLPADPVEKGFPQAANVMVYMLETATRPTAGTKPDYFYTTDGSVVPLLNAWGYFKVQWFRERIGSPKAAIVSKYSVPLYSLVSKKSGRHVFVNSRAQRDAYLAAGGLDGGLIGHVIAPGWC